jgi:hypothetical protein
MRFAHIKARHRFERLRLRGLSGAREEFHVASTFGRLLSSRNQDARERSVEPKGDGGHFLIAELSECR